MALVADCLVFAHYQTNNWCYQSNCRDYQIYFRIGSFVFGGDQTNCWDYQTNHPIVSFVFRVGSSDFRDRSCRFRDYQTENMYYQCNCTDYQMYFRNGNFVFGGYQTNCRDYQTNHPIGNFVFRVRSFDFWVGSCMFWGANFVF